MRFDAMLPIGDLARVPAIASSAEEMGFDCLWVSETRHDPFLPLGMAAVATSRIELGTSIAVAFPRSPTVIAHTAWDLARLLRGRSMWASARRSKPTSNAASRCRGTTPWLACAITLERCGPFGLAGRQENGCATKGSSTSSS